MCMITDCPIPPFTAYRAKYCEVEGGAVVKMPKRQIAEVISKESKFFGKKGLLVQGRWGNKLVKFPNDTSAVYFKPEEVRVFEYEAPKEEECPDKIDPSPESPTTSPIVTPVTTS